MNKIKKMCKPCPMCHKTDKLLYVQTIVPKKIRNIAVCCDRCAFYAPEASIELFAILKWNRYVKSFVSGE